MTNDSIAWFSARKIITWSVYGNRKTYKVLKNSGTFLIRTFMYHYRCYFSLGASEVKKIENGWLCSYVSLSLSLSLFLSPSLFPSLFWLVENNVEKTVVVGQFQMSQCDLFKLPIFSKSFFVWGAVNQVKIKLTLLLLCALLISVTSFWEK